VRAFLILMSALTLSGCTDPEIERAKELVAAKFIDPRSTQFEEVHRVAHSGAICGLANSKNSFGAYTGFTLFAVLGEDVHVMDVQLEDEPRQPYLPSAIELEQMSLPHLMRLKREHEDYQKSLLRWQAASARKVKLIDRMNSLCRTD
jgi:hypothetical protein